MATAAAYTYRRFMAALQHLCLIGYLLLFAQSGLCDQSNTNADTPESTAWLEVIASDNVAATWKQLYSVSEGADAIPPWSKRSLEADAGSEQLIAAWIAFVRRNVDVGGFEDQTQYEQQQARLNDLYRWFLSTDCLAGVMLADAVERVQLYRLARFAWTHPELSAELLESNPFQQFSKVSKDRLFTVVKTRLARDKAVSLRKTLLGKDEDVLAGLIEIAKKYDGADGRFEFRTSRIIADGNAIGLVWRRIQTEAIRDVFVPTLLDYLSSGGTPDRLRHFDAREVAAVLGESEVVRTCQFMQIKQGGPEHVVVVARWMLTEGDPDLLVAALK